jgi:hypothetical protein
MRKHPNSHREAKATAPVLDSTAVCRLTGMEESSSTLARLSVPVN